MLLFKAVELYKKYMATMDRSKETIKSYSIELGLFSRFMALKYNGPVYLEEIKQQDIEDYLQSLKEKNYLPSSRNHSIYIIRSFYNFCLKKEYIIRNICADIDRIPAPQKERVFLTADEIRILISEIRSPIARMITSMLFYTGMRISECINLYLSDVDLKNKVINVRNTKNKKDRQLPIHSALELLLDDFIQNGRKRKNSPYLFTTNKTDRVSPDYINKKLRETTHRLGWTKKVTCHIIRHSFASSLVASNVNIVNIQKLLGHSNLATTSIYTHTNLAELRNAISTI